MKHNWENIDWSKTDAAIARELGASPSSVTRKRHALKIAPVQPRSKVSERVNWRTQPWETKNNREIAKDLGCSTALVSIKRSEYAKHLERPRHTNFAWKGQDWTETNEDIAKAKGLTLSAVAAARNRHANGVRAARRKPGKRQAEKAAIAAKLSERKTVHQWLNKLAIPVKENGKDICLLRRIRIALDELFEFKKCL